MFRKVNFRLGSRPLSQTRSHSQRQPGGAAVSTSTIIGRRSKEEIDRLVQQRVQERDQWLVDGVPARQPDGWEIMRAMRKLRSIPQPTAEELDPHFPVQPLDWSRIINPPHDKIQITWLGHASLLVQMGGSTFLTDPVFSERASPIQFAGPKRLRPTPCSLSDLLSKTSIDVVLISHNHYDHLDYNSVAAIHENDKTVSFVVPLGLADWFRRWVSSGEDSIVLQELDWHENFDFQSSLSITSVPMRHWSNRIGDRDKTLWCGYSIDSTRSKLKFLFPGDTAWFDGMEEIVGKYGPYDVAAIPIGAYEPRDFMKVNHVNVEEAIRMKDAVQAVSACPIHWGTFPLTTEPVLEPREKLVELMKDRDDSDSFAPWLIGETKCFGSLASASCL